jgi:hypothetical protein
MKNLIIVIALLSSTVCLAAQESKVICAQPNRDSDDSTQTAYAINSAIAAAQSEGFYQVSAPTAVNADMGTKVYLCVTVTRVLTKTPPQQP